MNGHNVKINKYNAKNKEFTDTKSYKKFFI